MRADARGQSAAHESASRGIRRTRIRIPIVETSETTFLPLHDHSMRMLLASKFDSLVRIFTGDAVGMSAA